MDFSFDLSNKELSFDKISAFSKLLQDEISLGRSEDIIARSLRRNQ